MRLAVLVLQRECGCFLAGFDQATWLYLLRSADCGSIMNRVLVHSPIVAPTARSRYDDLDEASRRVAGCAARRQRRPEPDARRVSRASRASPTRPCSAASGAPAAWPCRWPSRIRRRSSSTSFATRARQSSLATGAARPTLMPLARAARARFVIDGRRAARGRRPSDAAAPRRRSAAR